MPCWSSVMSSAVVVIFISVADVSCITCTEAVGSARGPRV